MTIIEKHRTELKLIDQATNELTLVMNTLKASAEENQAIVEELQARADTLKTDLEKMTAQWNQSEAEIEKMEEGMQKLIALHAAEREKLKNEIQREMTERKDAIELMRKSFTQIQDLMNSTQNLMNPPHGGNGSDQGSGSTQHETFQS